MRVPWRSSSRTALLGLAKLRPAAIAALALLPASFLLAPATFAQSWAPMATISGTATLVTNSLCYTDGTDLLCNGSGPAASAASPTITTGVSGSIVYRDQYGLLIASNSLSISSTTGSVGIGAGAPANIGNNALYASGIIEGDSLYALTRMRFNTSGLGSLDWLNANNSINGNATSQYIALTTSGTEALRIVSTGYVGIGTATPAGPLDISGTNGRMYLDPNGQRLVFTRNSTNYIQTITSSSELGFITGGNTQQFTIKSDGATIISKSLSIGGGGTIAASATLDLSGTLKISNGGEVCDTNRLGAIKYTSGAFYVCQSVSNGWEALGTTGANANNDRIISGTTQAIAYNNTSLSLVTSGTERLVIGTNGEVGINSQPSGGNALYINGTTVGTRFRTATINGGTAASTAFGWNGASGSGMYFPASDTLAFSTSATEALRIVSTGYVGIGTTTPISKFSMLGGNFTWGASSYSSTMGTDQGGYLALGAAGNAINPFTGGTPYIDFHYGNGIAESYNVRLINGGDKSFSIATSGNGNVFTVSSSQVGIGTTNPSYTLDVSGSIRSFSSTGSNITIDPTGGFAGGTRLRYGGTTNRFTLQGQGNTTYLNIIDGYTSIGSSIGNNFPSTTLHLGGSIRLGAETSTTLATCDADRLGAIKYQSSTFQICQSASNGWEPLATSGPTSLADRITSNSQAGVIANSTGYISLTTGGVTGTAYFTPASVLINAGVSTTGPISTTGLYVSDALVIDNGSSLILKPPAGGGTLLAAMKNAGSGRLAFSVNNITSFEARPTGIFLNSAAVLDQSSNPLFTFSNTVTSATNALKVTNAATGNNPALGVSGTDTDIGLTIATKGAGSVYISSTMVGIGTTTPSSTLHVIGNVRIGSQANAGKFAIIDSGGVNWTMQPSGTAQFAFVNNANSNYYYSFFSNNAANYQTRLGVNTSIIPSTTLDISGTIRMADGGEACDTNRLGAIKYAASTFQICQSASNGWEPLATGGVSSTQDRIISGTTQAIAYNNTSLSLVTAGIERMVIGTTGRIGIAQQPVGGVALAVSGDVIISNGRLSLLTATGNNVLAGNAAGSSNSGTYVTAFGNGTASSNTGSNITAVGQNAAGTNTGSNIVAVGYQAAATNSSSNVVAVGYGAAQTNSGTNVTAVGYQAATTNNAASVSAFGSGTAQNNTGIVLSAFGSGAGASNSGANVTAVGFNTAFANTGGFLTAVGGNAGLFNSGTSTTAIGYYAAGSNTGGGATALGAYAGQSNNGSNLTAVGYLAGQTNSGTNVTAIGANAAQFNASSFLTAIGYSAALNNSSTNVTALGYQAARDNSGANSTAVGYQAAQNNTAANLTAIGASAGQNSAGTNVTAVGVNAAQLNSGTDLAAFGVNAAKSNTSTGVTAIGANAAQNNTGQNITAVGLSSAQANTGANLTALGYQTAQYNTGANNTAVGYQAMQFKTTGVSNAVFGTSAGLGVSNTSAYANNSLFGAFSGLALTTGGSNTLIGYNSGAGITTGQNNLVLGAQTTPYSNTGSYQLNIANAIWGNIGSGTGNANLIGINVPSPTTALEVAGTISATNITINGQAITGGAPTISTGLSGSIVYRDQSGLLIASSGLSISSTTGSVGIGAGAPSSIGNSGLYVAGIMQSDIVQAQSRIRLNNAGSAEIQWLNISTSIIGNATSQYLAFNTSNTEALRIVSTGLVGIGTSFPSTTLHIAGSGLKLTLSNGSSKLQLSENIINANQDLYLQTGGNNVYLGNYPTSKIAIALNGATPSTTLHVSGSIRIADGGEACDTNRAGAIRYTSTSIFQSCNGTAWSALSGGGNATGDAIISGSTSVTANSATSIISLTNAGTTWGYFASAGSYLPQLNATGISATTVTASLIVFNGISATAGVSSSSSGGADNLGNHTATATLDMASNNIINAAKIGVGTATPGTYALYVTGDAYSTGAWSTSDARFKENIHGMTGLLTKIDQLRPVTFTWKPNSMPARTISGTQIGLIAQEVEKIYPELVKTNTDGYKAVAYDKLGVLLLGAVKDLKAQNDDLRTQLNQMRRDIETLKHQPAR